MILVENLAYRYDREAPAVLNGISLAFAEGSHTALIGPNGCGKTTLIKHLNALLVPSAGKVSVDGMATTDSASVREIRRRVGMVFQNPDSQIVGMTVEEDVAFGPGNLALPPAEIRRRVDESLAMVGMEGFDKRAPHTLSGGEKRLLSIAGVLAMKPRYIAFDEPTAYLDPAGKQRVLEIIRKLHAEGLAIIHIAHDMHDVAGADRAVVMNRGRILLDGTPAEVFAHADTLGAVGLDVPSGGRMPVISLGQYLPGETLLHRLDPRVKIVAVISLSVFVFGAGPAQVTLISIALAMAIGTAGLRPTRIALALRPVAFFMAAIFLTHLFLTDGRPLLDLSPLPLRVTLEGFIQGAHVTWQFAALVIAAAVLTMTTPPSDLVAGIERLLRPLSWVGLPPQDIAVMIAMALRFVPMLGEEYDRIRMAQMARGADFTTGSLALRVRAAAALAIPLLLSAFRRADELVLAMESRGYRRGPRTSLRELKLLGTDFIAFAVLAAFALMNLGLEMLQ